ncbi:hypothetical protein [Actinoplanes sp. NPDC049316]|uniref:hypothetical protein n=1 Tax=Actinoplanes sp. NPDC049316 TaxID=3154727 RepID=UPI0034284CD6
MALRRVGFYREIHPDSTLPWLRERSGTRRTRSEAEIVAYLRSGHMISAVMEGSRDVFDDTPFPEGSGCSSFLTDGAWVWRNDLSHYVEKYHVQMPDEFVRHLVESGFRVPDMSPERLAELVEVEKRELGPDWWTTPW